MRDGDKLHREVFGFLHIRSPPLGSTDTGTCNDRIREQIEISAGIVVAGIVFQNGSAGLRLREVVGKEGLDDAIEIVVSGSHRHIISRLVLGIGTFEGCLFYHAQEQVALEGEFTGNNLQAENTGIVGIVNETEIVQRVVFEGKFTQLSGIETDEGTHALIDCVIHKLQGLGSGSLTDVKHITAYGSVGIDVVDFAAVVNHISQNHIVAPLVHETLGIVGDDTVLVGDIADILAFHGTAVLVLDSETEAGRTGGGGCTAEFHGLEVEVVTGFPVIGNMEFTLDHGLGTVRRLFADEGETAGDIHGLNGIGRAFHLQEDLGTGGLQRIEQRFAAGNCGKYRKIRRRPGIHLAAAGTQVHEGKDIFRAGLQAFHHREARSDLGLREGMGKDNLIGPGKGHFNTVHLHIVRHFSAPCERYRVGTPI